MIPPKTVEILPWDSNFFGKSIARVLTGRLKPDDLKAILEWAQEDSIDCLYYLADSRDLASIWFAQNSGFLMVDIRTTLSWTAEDADPNLPVINTDKIREAEIPDLPDLERIARNSFIHTRFYVDEHFPRELCDSLYATWIRQSLLDAARTVFVASTVGELNGFITCLKEGPHGKIGLLGIDPGSQRKGIGSSLVYAAVHWFERKGISTVEVVTQGSNIAAQRLYQQAGFRTSQVQLWFHKWFAES